MAKHGEVVKIGRGTIGNLQPTCKIIANPSLLCSLQICEGLESPQLAEVGFEDYDDDVEEVEVDKTPKRKVHGRTPTAFVPKKAASPDARDLVAAADWGEFVAAWQLCPSKGGLRRRRRGHLGGRGPKFTKHELPCVWPVGDVESCMTRMGSPPSTGPRTGQ